MINANVANTVAPMLLTGLMARLQYFLTDQFVDDLADKIAHKFYELEQRDQRTQRYN